MHTNAQCEASSLDPELMSAVHVIDRNMGGQLQVTSSRWQVREKWSRVKRKRCEDKSLRVPTFSGRGGYKK